MNKGLAMVRLLSEFGKDQSGATAIEYSILAAGIALAIIATVQGLGTNVNAMFGTVLTALN
jgi:pilus assembly protein Flp/PilA